MNKTLEFIRKGDNITHILQTVYDVNQDGVITDAEVAERKPLDLIIDITNTDLSLGNKIIGVVPANKLVTQATISVKTAFDGVVTMSIGDDLDNSRFMSLTDNDVSIVGDYSLDINYQYSSDTEVKIYFTATGCTTGTAKIILL